LVRNVPPTIRSWVKPIVIGRHAYGDIYKSAEMRIPEPGRVDLVFTPAGGGGPESLGGDGFGRPCRLRGAHSLGGSLRPLARACINYALSERMDMWFSAKDTIAKIYHGTFREIFRQETEARRADFEKAGIQYIYMLIDDAVAKVVRSPGGFLWACMN